MSKAKRNFRLKVLVSVDLDKSTAEVEVRQLKPFVSPSGETRQEIKWIEPVSFKLTGDITRNALIYGIKQYLSDKTAGIYSEEQVRKALEQVLETWKEKGVWQVETSRSSKLTEIRELTKALREALEKGELEKAQELSKKLAELTS